jgi:hypothetical protein
MTQSLNATHAHVGDWLEVGGPPGTMARRGQVLEVLGAAGHTHFRVRWDEEHESLFYPTDGALIVHQGSRHEHTGDTEEAGT